ncbi:MAG: 6-bladed beta-propeller, partial [Cyclonatronaceae bacterium]
RKPEFGTTQQGIYIKQSDSDLIALRASNAVRSRAFKMSSDDTQFIELKGAIINMERALIYISESDRIIVGDSTQNLVFVFDMDGELLFSFGRSGRGPGEFNFITGIMQLSMGDILVSEPSGRIHRFSDNGTFLRTYNIPITGNMVRMTEINSRKLLLAGLNKRGAGNLLHFFDLDTGDITQSFFEAPFEMGAFGGVLYSQSSTASAIFDGTYIYAFISFKDALYVFDLNANLINVVDNINFEHILPLTPEPERLSERELAEKMESFSRITNLYWVDEDVMLIEHYKSVDVQLSPFRFSVEYGFAIMKTNGTVIAEESNVPRTYGFNGDEGLIYRGAFENPTNGTQLIEELPYSIRE